MKGVSLVVQFLLFFLIGLGLFTSIGGIFRTQSDIIREDVSEANRKLIGSYISSIAISMASNCKECNYSSVSLELEQTKANYILVLNFSSKGLQIFSEPEGRNTSASIHLLNNSLSLSRNASSYYPIILVLNGTSNQLNLSTPLKSVFVTSEAYELGVDFTSVADADNICQARAKTAGFTGTWVAWLSTPTTNAKDLIVDAKYYYRTDGFIIARSKADLIDGSLVNSIKFDENGKDVGQVNVWTGTKSDGTAAESNTCDGFTNLGGTVAIGISTTTTGGWTNSFSSQCAQFTGRFYCFEK